MHWDEIGGLAVIVAVFFVVLMLIHRYDEQQWDKFKVDNGCKAMTAQGNKVAYQCDHGITIWR